MTPVVSFRARFPHYVDHLAPIYFALPEENRGAFVCYTDDAMERAAEWTLPYVTTKPNVTNLAASVVAGTLDLHKEQCGTVPIVFVEHGAGQTYKRAQPHSSYSGARPGSRRGVKLFLCPNDRVKEANDRTMPVKSVVVGSPHVDHLEYERQQVPPGIFGTKTNVVVSFHWDAHVQGTPEIRWAFTHFKHAIAGLRDTLGDDVHVFGHAHPRAREYLQAWFEALGIKFIRDLDVAATLADVFVADNTSALYELAALDIPVVVLNAPWYRREVDHGLRFWEYADIGYQVDAPENLASVVQRTIADPTVHRDRRAEVSSALYPHRGDAAERSAAAVLDLIQSGTVDPDRGKE